MGGCFSVLEVIISTFGEGFFVFLWVAYVTILFIMLAIYPTIIAPWFNKFENLNEKIPKEKELLEQISVLAK